ncbi:hypothetical protein Tco_1397863, partial [Tanacetum coccineum]
AEFDESNAYMLERFYTSARNPVKEILLELNLPDHRLILTDMKILKDRSEGVPVNVYALVSHHRIAKDLWERIELLMQGMSLTKQERECKLYDSFDKFAYIKGETLYQFTTDEVATFTR